MAPPPRTPTRSKGHTSPRPSYISGGEYGENTFLINDITETTGSRKATVNLDWPNVTQSEWTKIIKARPPEEEENSKEKSERKHAPRVSIRISPSVPRTLQAPILKCQSPRTNHSFKNLAPTSPLPPSWESFHLPPSPPVAQTRVCFSMTNEHPTRRFS